MPLRDLLVISDLHLGEDIGVRPRLGDQARFALQERELATFLDAHAGGHRGQPWRLVVNGDMVDYLAMTLMPADGGVVSGIDPDDHWYGLGTTKPAALAKTEAALRRNDDVYRALARFIGAGNDVVIIVGNHDVEMYWPEVQRRWIDAVADLWADERSRGAAGARTREEVARSITFEPWFFHEGGVWIEHGHLYDPLCAIPDVLQPFTADGKDIVPSLSSAAMRYVNNHYSPHEGHVALWSLSRYLWWFVGQGASRMAAILGSFAVMAQRVLRLASGPRRRRHARALVRMRGIARRQSLDPNTLLRVDALRRKPVTLDRRRLLRAMRLDRLFLTSAGVVVLLSALLVLPWTGFAVVGLLLAVALIAANHYLERGADVAISNGRLRGVARKIRGRTKASVVVFGHTHDAMAVRDEDGWTFNTGTWVPDEERGLERVFTHLYVERDADGRPTGSLRRWSGGRSRPYTP